MAALARMGYPLLEPDKQEDPHEVLAALVQTDDVRLLEGFPVVLAHCLKENFKLNVERMEGLLSNEELRQRFWLMLATSRYLFYSFGMKFPEKLEYSVRVEFKSAANQVSFADREKKSLKVGADSLSLDRLKNTFLNYVVRSRKLGELTKTGKAELQEDFRREYYLSLLLSPRQKDLLYKKLRAEPMTKTEKEYFSRVVKKKLQALADPELHLLAQKALR